MIIDRTFAILFMFAFLFSASLMLIIMYNFYKDHPEVPTSVPNK